MTAPPHPPTLLSHRLANKLQNGADISICPLFIQTFERYVEIKVSDPASEEAREQRDNTDRIRPPPRHQCGWVQSGSPIKMRQQSKGTFKNKIKKAL